MAPSIVSDIDLPRDIPESRQSAANVPIQKAFGLDNRTVIITGAGRGLGITLAVAVLESGADAVCLDILPEPSAEEWEIITKLQKSTGVRATYHRCDITNEEAVEKVVADCGEEARQRGKPVKGMISCAGIQQMVDAIDYPMDGFRRVLELVYCATRTSVVASS
jgi:NAD(P)-dependent dehydrogenase (short-subunit alcohol dehydrogenase family)